MGDVQVEAEEEDRGSSGLQICPTQAKPGFGNGRRCPVTQGKVLLFLESKFLVKLLAWCTIKAGDKAKISRN